ncbi:MAG TPA: DPP IV N-terminal domain-containing protein, partial [Pyrinomonadaceae bacterium]|nr:DPP IV N-terminal domain-containing protein [Pyrinomonadaceae bacterium]
RVEGNNLAVLHQMPVLGGAQKKLLNDADGAVSYSPDGRQFSYVRGNFPNLGESALLIANADGTGERIVALRKRPETFPWWRQPTPVWSADGKSIACVIGGDATGSGTMSVVEVQVADGTMKAIPGPGWYEIKSIAALPDQGGFLVLGADKPSAYYAQQIWHLGANGESRRITTDFNDYLGMSVTADTNALVAVQSNRISNIWVAPNKDAASAVLIKSGGSNQDGTDGLAWTPDGRQVVFYSRASGADDIWIMNADGSGLKQLTIDVGTNYDCRVTPDGRFIVFTSERSGHPNLWRMDLDGGNAKQLTSGNSDFNVTISPDSKWIVYESSASGRPGLWKVSIDGATSKLAEYASENPEISPDGKYIAFQYREDTNSPWRYAIIPFEGGQPVKVFDFPPTKAHDFRWMPDSRSLSYIDTRGGVSNIWIFPLDGAPPKPLTDFKTDQINNFKWSPDGKQLVLARGTTTSDVVLIKDFR